MTGKSIRLHPKYGANPTVSLCAWCGNERGDIALLGSAYKGEAPRHMIVDDEPCDTCKGNMAKGVTLIEATPTDGKPTRTGRWVVIDEASVSKLFRPDDVVADLLAKRAAYVTPDMWVKLGLPTTAKES